ncbi:MAG TPA: response regulator [Thermoanaerobaculia bacterium]|nr:response regulator [Thermoanaerobaculia bacterium]
MTLPPISAVIIDDEVAARRRLRRLLETIDGVQVVGEAGDAADAIALIEAARPAIAFVDIEMPEVSGIELARSLERANAPEVIFVTAYDDHALEAFEVAASDYLLKPVTAERLRTAIERVRRRPARGVPARRPGDGPFRRVMVRAPNGWRILPVSAIIAATVEHKVVYIHTVDGALQTNYEIGELEHDLDEAQFVRVHRQHLVNLSQVRELRALMNGALELVMSNGQRIVVSRSYGPAVRARLHR